MKQSANPIIVEEYFKVSIQKLWSAITKHDEMIQWYFENIESFIPKIGFETQFLIENEGRKFTHLWKIMEVIPFEKISYRWKFSEYAGESLVSWALSELEGRVKLTLTAEVLASFPDNIPEFERESGVQGWNYFIRERLKPYLEK